MSRLIRIYIVCHSVYVFTICLIIVLDNMAEIIKANILLFFVVVVFVVVVVVVFCFFLFFFLLFYCCCFLFIY